MGSAIGFLALSVACTGVSTNLAYLHTLSRVSHALLPSFANQTLTGYLTRRMMPPPASLTMEIYPTPLWFRLVNAAAAGVAVAALAARVIAIRRAGCNPDRVAVPALLVMSLVFAPVAWTHYYLLLLPAVVVLVGEAVRQGRQARRQAAEGIRPAWNAG